MIARGDFAVECGYERLAEVHGEIMWLCQAAHLPVIWATQVLDRLARPAVPHVPSSPTLRWEYKRNASCGPQIVEAITVLDDILCRMKQHQRRKRSLLPRLVVSDYRPTLG